MDGASSPQDAIIHYPDTGNIAVVVCSSSAGIVITVYSNSSAKTKVLATFNTLGVGSVSYSNGKPWLVVTEHSWSVSDRKGNIIERGKFPRNSDDIRCDPTEHLSVRFKDRQTISLTFTTDTATYTWQCGERLKRNTSHLDKVVGSSKGKLQLDIDAIRERQATVGNVYVSKGPHAYPTDRGGLGSMTVALKSIRRGSDLDSTVQALQSSDQRIKAINTLPVALYGTSRNSNIRSTDTTSQNMHSTGSAAASAMLSSSSDFGNPPMSSKQRKWQRASALQRQRPAYQLQRSKIPTIPSQEHLETQIIGRQAERDTLYCLCLLADWQPSCGRLSPKLEAGWHVLQQQAQQAPDSHASRIKVLHVDASSTSGKHLQQARDFRTVPMFLMYYQSKLVYASNNISCKEELVSACLQSLERGRKGEALSPGFKFSGRDNFLLDHIQDTMNLVA